MHPESICSLAAETLEIEEVLDLETGEYVSAREKIGSDYEKALQLRMALKQGIAANKPLLGCSLCAVPVHLVSLSQERRFYFRHEIEDGRCLARTKAGLSEKRILAMKYDGARESDAHLRMKAIIAESLRQDPDFSGIEVERVWKGEEANNRRKPDVRAVWRGSLPVAFEVQLSTTFLRVIAERREFYLKEGGLLFWVFKDFDMGNTRLTMEDVFYNNNRNAFVASEETLIASREAGALRLDCVWSEPSIDEGQLLWTQKSGRVAFGELTIEQGRQRAFHFDADAARERCEALTKDWPLRNAFKRFWLSKGEYDDAEWVRLRTEILNRGIELPRYRGEAVGLRQLLDTLYSAEAGEPVGDWGYSNLVQLGHHVFDRYKGFLWAFRLMLAAHGRGPVIAEHDGTRNWRDNKVKAYLAAWRVGDSDFSPDRRYDRLACFLFPEIAQRLVLPPS